MNRKKLSQLIIDMRAKRGENQREFAKYFSQLGGKKVSYGFIQTLEDTEKTSLPEWGNMKTIAKMWNVSVGELDFYLENDDIKDLKDASKVYQQLTSITPNKDMFFEAAKSHLSTEELFDLTLKLLEQSKSKIVEADKIKQMFTNLKGLNDLGIA